MAGFTDALEQALLNHIFTDPAYVPPATLYIGLSSTTPTDAGGNVTEPVGGAYSRVPTNASDWGPAAGTAPASKTTIAGKTFSTATADWLAGTNLTYFLLFDASSAGNVVAFGALTTAKPVLNGDTPSFAAGSLTLKLGDPSDTY